MAILVSDLESVLVNRTRGILVAAGFSTLTDGENPDMRDPISWGLDRIGIYPSSGVWIQDDDLVGWTIAGLRRGLEYAEYRLLVNVSYSDTFVDTRAGENFVMLSQTLKGLEMRIGWLTKRLGLTTRPLVGGFITKRLSPTVSDELSRLSGPEGSP